MTPDLAPLCANCVWYGDRDKETEKCYADLDYHDATDTCPHWQDYRQRLDPLTGKPYPDDMVEAPLRTDDEMLELTRIDFKKATK